MSIREVKGSPREQGVDERIIYTFDFADGPVDAPQSAVVTAFDVTATRTDVTSTVLPSGSASIAGSVITCPLFRDLTAGQVYRLECKATGADGQVEELYLVVKALV